MKGNTQIYFAGQNISSTYISHLLEMLEGKDISINVISKSGTTTEPALLSGFSEIIWKRNMEKKKQKNGFMQQPIKKKGLKTTCRLKKGMKHLLFLTMLVEDTPS